MSAEGGTWHALGPVTEFPPEGVRGVQVAGRPLAVGRDGDRYFAVEGTCPHAGGLLGEGCVEDGRIVCPQHGFAFSVITGGSEDTTLRIGTFAVRVRGGVLEVRI